MFLSSPSSCFPYARPSVVFRCRGGRLRTTPPFFANHPFRDKLTLGGSVPACSRNQTSASFRDSTVGAPDGEGTYRDRWTGRGPRARGGLSGGRRLPVHRLGASEGKGRGAPPFSGRAALPAQEGGPRIPP